MNSLRRMIGVVALGVLLAGCAGTTIAGTAAPIDGAGPVDTDPPYSSTFECAANPSPVAVTTPTGEPLITVTQGTNAWIANNRTQPLSLAAYDDGTAIRSEDAGLSSDAIAALTIGRIDPCRLADASAEIVALAATDIGEPGVTDQGTTSVVLHQPAGDVRVNAYALGVGDDGLPAAQQAARQRLTALIDGLRGSLADTADWTPDRLRVTTYGEPADDAGAAPWPLTGGVAKVLDRDDHRCGVLSGADAAAVLDAIGAGPAVQPWTDGQRTLVLAFGPLVPGQRGCAG